MSPATMWILLIALTAIAGFLRFWRLDAQAYWTDEAYTIGRISGSFDFLLSKLTDQGFPPGWYALLRWWRLIVESKVGSEPAALLPQYMRILPALFGTLTIPALYFLGRQFTDRRGALLVALLGAVNPFLIYYSRDIKMYAALWFFVTLNMALFFQWQTSRRHWLWMPLFALTGAAMVAIQSIAWAVVALQLIFLITRPRLRPLDGPLWMLCIGLMALFPVYWYYDFLHPAQWTRRLANDTEASMEWIILYTDMSWHTIAGLPTSHLLGYLWPVYPPDDRIVDWFLLGDDFNEHLATRSLPWLAQWQMVAGWALFALLFAGLIPWRRLIGRAQPPVDSERENAVTRGRWWWVALWILIPTAGFALTWIPPGSPWFERVWHTLNPKPLWEPRYLGIILPAWLLWLAASIRRLPTLPVRVLITVALVAACTWSSLSNHLIQRNPPFQEVASTVAKYSQGETSAFVVVPMVKYPDPAEYMAAANARGLVPRDRIQNPGFRPWHSATSAEDAIDYLRMACDDPRYSTLVLTDKFGDLAADPAADPLSEQALARILGPRWKLVHTGQVRWYYEWRFYIFSTWRTRVWQLQSESPREAPATLR